MDETPRLAPVVGRYVMFGPIAAGGMATIHLGRRVDRPSPVVAVKRLHAHLASDPEFSAMFVDEARLAARVRHPNVVLTLDVVGSDAELLLVMEYVHGESLAQLLRAAREAGSVTPPRIAAAIVAGALHGLHAAHQATNEAGEPLHVVHRDVSPQNVLVGEDGVARVLDFGIAKARGRLRITLDGQVRGKVQYMAPEQLLARGVDAAADQYAAAVVLWETLTGKRMFEGNSPHAAMEQIRAGAVRRPSEVRSSLTEAFDDVTMRGLAKDPRDRYATAEEMAIAVEQCAGVATPSEVGAWVRELAKTGLATRAAALAEAERASLPPPPPPSVRSPVPEPPLASQPPESAPSEPPPVSSRAPLGPPHAPASSRPRPRSVTALVGASLIGAALLAASLTLVAHRARSTSGSPAAASFADPPELPTDLDLPAAAPPPPPAALSADAAPPRD